MAGLAPGVPAHSQCSTQEFNNAILDQKKLIEFETNERIATRPRYMTALIPDGGVMDPHDDGRTYKMRRGHQAPIGYDDYSHTMDCDPLANMQDGYQTAQSECGNQAVTIGTLVNSRNEAEACEGVCIVDFAQGGSFEGFTDRELKLATPVRCIEELAKYERRRIADYLAQEVDSFRDTAVESFEYDLFRLVVERAGANATVLSVQDQPLPVLTAGGWSAPPTNRVTISFLERYRLRIIERLMSTKFAANAENYVMEIEMTRDAWYAAKVAECLFRTGPGGTIPGLGEQIRINESAIKEGKMMGRAFEMWDGKIKVIFNDHPIRGIMKPAGQSAAGKPLYEFVRVYHLKNEANEIGVSVVSNPDYYYNQAECDGQMYDMIELIPHIHSGSFKRYGLAKAIGPDGVVGHNNNFEVKLLRDADLSSKDCPNYFGGYYQYAARHHYRFRDIYPELSGFIAHKHEIMHGYDMANTGEVLLVKDGVACAEVEEIDNCNEKTCAEESCLPAAAPCVDTVTIEPCGTISTAWCGEDSVLVVSFERDCAGANAAQVTACAIDGTAVLGTHFQPIDTDGNALPADNVIDWAADEEGVKQLCFRITGGLDDTPGDAPADTNCCLGTADTPNDATFTVQIKTPTGTTIGCDTVTVNIKNYS